MRTSARLTAVLLFDEVELLDVAGVAHVLSIAGRHWNWRPFKLFLASMHSTLVSTRNQMRIESHGLLTQCPPPEIVIVPGGYGARRACSNVQVASWLAEHGGRAELVASVGAGGLLLVRAGLVQRGPLALPGELHDAAREMQADLDVIDTSEVVQVENRLSVAASAGSIDLGLEIVGRLLGKKSATSLAQKLGHGPASALAVDLPGPLLKPR